MNADMHIPVGVVSRVDLGRLVREIEALDAYIKSAEVRQPGTSIGLPKTSKLLDELLQLNSKNVLIDQEREAVKHFLEGLRDSAPSIHMSFSADPSPLFTQKLVLWLRQNIHPLVLLQIGLQPAIGAGTIVRTTNKYFDMSLRNFFADKKPLLLSKMRHEATAADAPSAQAASTQSTETPIEVTEAARPVDAPAVAATEEVSS